MTCIFESDFILMCFGDTVKTKEIQFLLISRKMRPFGKNPDWETQFFCFVFFLLKLNTLFAKIREPCNVVSLFSFPFFRVSDKKRNYNKCS